MSLDLKTLNKPQKMKLAEKHLQKYVLELKRHFDFSDFQIIKLLENSSQNIKKNQYEKLFKIFHRFFKINYKK